MQMAIFNSFAKLPKGTSSGFVSEIYRIVTGMWPPVPASPFTRTLRRKRRSGRLLGWRCACIEVCSPRSEATSPKSSILALYVIHIYIYIITYSISPYCMYIYIYPYIYIYILCVSRICLKQNGPARKPFANGRSSTIGTTTANWRVIALGPGFHEPTWPSQVSRHNPVIPRRTTDISAKKIKKVVSLVSWTNWPTRWCPIVS